MKHGLPTLLLQHFGEAVRSAHEELAISQEELAARCNLHRTYVAGVERGIRNPSLKSIEKIALGLGLKVSALFLRMEAAGKSSAKQVASRKGA